MNLFDMNENTRQLPLASRMRPEKLDEIVGQLHIIGKDKLLYRAIKADRLGSIILYGPPGVGKTTIARVIANTTKSYFCKLNATNAGIKDLEKIIEEAKFNQNAYQKGTGGDARSVLNALELAYLTTERNKKGIISITLEVAEQCIQKKAIRYDKNGDNHYDTISAFIESMKHTDPDATLYYLARMLIAGEDVKYIARRICVCASEDIGLANSQALVVATNAFLAVERIGMPESTTILAHAALYVCCSPKSSAVSNGIYQAMDEANKTTDVPIPAFLQDASYKNAYKLGRGVGLDNVHQFPNHYSGKKCMPDELDHHHYFNLSQMGSEKRIQAFLDYLKKNTK